jgi:hypothetical protein
MRKDVHDDMASAGAYSGGAAVYLLEASRRRGAGGDGEAMRGSSLSVKIAGRADEETEEEARTDRMVEYAVGVVYMIPRLVPLLLIPISSSNSLSSTQADSKFGAFLGVFLIRDDFSCLPCFPLWQMRVNNLHTKP